MIFDKLKAYGAIAAAIVLGALLLVQTGRLHTALLDAAKTRTENAQTLRNIADITVKAAQAYRAQETQWVKSKEENARETATKIEAANADAASARSASNRLRQRVAALVSAARAAAAHPGAGPAVAPADDPAGMLANVLGRIDERAGVLAAHADAARIAGASCEREHDALTEPLRRLVSTGAAHERPTSGVCHPRPCRPTMMPMGSTLLARPSR